MIRFRTNLILLCLLALTGVTVVAKEYKGYKYKGTLDSVDAAKLVLRMKDAETIEFAITPETKVLRDERPAHVEDLQRDDLVYLSAERDGGLLVATSVFVMEPQ